VRRTAAWLAVLLLLFSAAGGWWMRQRLTTAYRGFSPSEIFVDLPQGSREADIARRLADAGVVPDVWTFRLAALLSHGDRRLQAGEYRFAEPATPLQVVARLVRGDTYTVRLTFPEGLTIREMAAVFERSGLGAASAFEAAASDASLAASIDPDAASLEGYLFPSTYTLSRHAGAAGAVHAMLAQFKRVLDGTLREDPQAERPGVHELVTLASIIEKETAQPAERPLVAAVLRNRLARHMPLQCDPTVIYALARAGRWTGDLTRADLQIDSPYNTYKYPGLPPGPIASPGRASLRAALHPADVPYVYFVSRNDGTHAFASTLEQHDRNVAKWQRRR
jgi:peptidoglycan lytic transglycosylase G